MPLKVDADDATGVSSRSRESGSVIRLGMSTVLSGDAERLGRDVRFGIRLALHEHASNPIGQRPTVTHAFEERRDRIGVEETFGRYRLLCLDDGYEPSRTVVNLRRLTGPFKADAIVGNVGTPTVVAALPILNETGTPLIGPFTGAALLRTDPPNPLVFNLRAGYDAEIRTIIDGLVEAGIRPQEIACLTQKDGYGDAGFGGAAKALARHGVPDWRTIGHGRYDRNSVNVEGALADLILHEPLPRAVLIVGAYRPAARAIRVARKRGFDPVFCNVSFVGSEALLESLGEHGDGVVVTQVVPPPWSTCPAATAFRDALRRFAPKRNATFATFEGYLVGRMVVAGTSTLSGNIDPLRVRKALEDLGQFDLGIGTPLSFNPLRHQASERVWGTVIQNRRMIDFGFDFRPLVRQTHSAQLGSR